LWNFKRFVHVGTGAWNVIAEFVGKGGRISRQRKFARDGKVVAGSRSQNCADVAISRPKFKLNNSNNSCAQFKSNLKGDNLVSVDTLRV
jgi:hypothetical protein